MGIKTILLDLDGVVTNFHLASLQEHGRPELYAQWPADAYDIHETLGISVEEFWHRLDTFQFWAEMPKTEHADAIIEACLATGLEVYFCTSAARGFSASGKEYWMRTNYPKIGWVMTRHKHLLARDDRLLLDDWEVNVKKFGAAGGNAVMVPAIHNCLRHCNPYVTVLNTLRALKAT